MPKIVLLGMMSKIPVAGVVWQTVHYLVGFRRLGFEVYYVEAHARTPSMFMQSEDDDGSTKAAEFIDRVMRRFDLGGRWAFHALHDDGRCYGMSDRELRGLYRSADLLINLHGGTAPLPEHAETGRLVYLETDPAALQIELHDSWQETIDFLEPHCAFFTFAENWGNDDCRLPHTDRFDFHPTRQPVILDFWSHGDDVPGDVFTTIGNWKQHWREIVFEGETYSWSKHHEFLKFLDIPERTGQGFELAVGGCEHEERQLLEAKGWRVRDPADLSADVDLYRSYIQSSRGEFTVAKDQNVRLRTGWFSDRSATYLAAGRPVVTQDTGFSNVLPSGDGLFAFTSSEDVVAAVEAVNGDYVRHSRAAAEIAREHFDANRVLARLLGHTDVRACLRSARGATAGRAALGFDRDGFPEDLVLEPISRRPLVLPPATVETVKRLEPMPPQTAREAESPRASIVVVTFGDLVPTKLCIESVLRNTDGPAYELIVVDNGSDPDARLYLGSIASGHRHVRALFNSANAGFARACNRGLAAARGDVLVLLNNDTVVPPKWLERLVDHLDDPEVGLVGPVTNRIGNEAEVGGSYRTYGELVQFAAQRERGQEHPLLDIGTATMFCLAMRRATFERIGPLDERFEVGLLEDDDYSERARRAGYRVVCADDVFVHHFGEASFGALVATGRYNEVLAANKRRFEEKWGMPWKPYERREKPEYEEILEQVRQAVRRTVPPGAHVLVASRGDERLLELGDRPASHFPQEHGVYAGHYPANADEAIAQVEDLRAQGAQFLVFPKPAFWWLEHYRELTDHLEHRYGAVVRDDSCVVFALDVDLSDALQPLASAPPLTERASS